MSKEASFVGRISVRSESALWVGRSWRPPPADIYCVPGDYREAIDQSVATAGRRKCQSVAR
jgi:hypothetical protein